MDYQKFLPSPDLVALINCYWTLEVPKEDSARKQRIVPDGCIEMAFILGDDIKRYTSDEEYVLQPREMVLGQILEPFFIEPTGYVNTFAISFFPFGFANFISTPIKSLANKETPIEVLFGEKISREIKQNIIQARNTEERIKFIETFLLNRLSQTTTIDTIVKTTVDTLLLTKGNSSITEILKNDLSKRRQLERKFKNQIGMSPKQLGKVIRLQTALKLLINREKESLTSIAYQSDYYDQAHFNRDFKEFTGVNPKEFLVDDTLALSALFYK